jgi:diadenosine tetraphosphatase ApaH/serine/threonine PP2A family protein phosphatase
MQYFIFSDVHSNLEGLVACLRDYVKHGKPSERTKDKIVKVLEEERLGVRRLISAELGGDDTVICLGDVVGYGADPVRCVDITIAVGDYFIGGNHDLAVAHKIFESNLKQMKDQWKWTYEQLNGTDNNLSKGNGHLSKLADISSVILQDFNPDGNGSPRKLRFTHGMPTVPQEFYYFHYDTMEVERFFESEMFFDVIAFVGHSHAPAVVVRNEGVYSPDLNYKVISMSPDKNLERSIGCFNTSKEERVLVGVPSVGQPRDKFTQTGYCIYNSETQDITFRRIPYNNRRAAQKIMERRDDEWCASRLMMGR